MQSSTPPIGRKKPVKIIVVGDSGVGKTAIISKFLYKDVNKNESATIGNVHVKTVLEKGNSKLDVAIWDTAGQEKYSSMVDIFFRGAKGCVIVYDITSFQSFVDTTSWYTSVFDITHTSIPIVLVGNKKDLSSQREVAYESAENLAVKWGALYLEVSAIEGTNIDIIFKSFVDKIEPEYEPENVFQSQSPKQRKCC
ncbi:hypothetical protein ENUP19_0263G0031 [Entamoeba nuttalli]|uniref:Rab family GTPase n=2 Tax=Entamoeba nuttalli TaxID=412467 RepID=K2GXF4_ENTNP|nr:Rab family GTPase [Entamoeba nuttalli P19]EKE39928.1 Rab family GTPase [Entamoeba nuttalli P19]|eukprot:XP_008857734.1 Rab family GTPase [Entamoeba nuttalli P19]